MSRRPMAIMLFFFLIPLETRAQNLTADQWISTAAAPEIKTDNLTKGSRIGLKHLRLDLTSVTFNAISNSWSAYTTYRFLNNNSGVLNQINA